MKVPVQQLQWLASRVESQVIRIGENLFAPGEPIDKLILITKGSITIKLQKKNQLQTIGQLKAPAISGLLPYSRATNAQGYGVVGSDTQIFTLEGDHFNEMICNCHELTTVLVHEMSTRIRELTKNAQMNDKLLSLGKLSAGLAHELNNPSAAVVRSSKELSKHLKYAPERFKQVVKIQMGDQQIDVVNEMLFAKINAGIQKVSLIERSEREDELISWLDELDYEDPEELADNALDYGFTIEDFELIGDNTPREHLPPVLNWVNQVITTEKLVGEIEDASSRINNLVLSIKSYTHMDQAPEKVPTDIHEGLDNTLTMLKHKLKSHQIEVSKNYSEELPQPEVLPSAINQVWTNLIDNAIDAMDESEHRNLSITTSATSALFTVAIADTGKGIPEDLKDQIFDPFFTTKAIGKGTGLGLENVMQIVKIQHNGTIEVKSQPGETIFTICIPIKSA